MGLKRLQKWLLFVAGAVGVSFVTILIFLPYGGTMNFVTSTKAIPADHTGIGLPVRLTIPKLAVDAAVEYVGLTSDGAMDVPKGPADVAWFTLGPRPGETGSAVIAGHFGWKNNIPAVFDDISTLRKGDTLSVTDKKGTATTFVVRELRTFDESENASAVFASSDGKAHLNLITCEGVWDAASKSYSKRLIVFTDKAVKNN